MYIAATVKQHRETVEARVALNVLNPCPCAFVVKDGTRIVFV